MSGALSEFFAAMLNSYRKVSTYCTDRSCSIAAIMAPAAMTLLPKGERMICGKNTPSNVRS
jgi:hypothetical protein